MARRFGDLKRGPLLNQMYTRYKQWEDRPLEERFNGVGNGPERSPTVFLGLEPFGRDLPGTAKYRVRSNQRNRGQFSTAVGARVTTTLTDATPNPGFVPALIKMKVVTGSSVVTSEITGRRYKKSLGESYQHPFGQAGTEREFEAYEAIVAAISGTNRRFSYSAERFRLN